MTKLTLKVPGNILLLGEYAILEEGGLGIAMAIDRSITFAVAESDSLKINGKRGAQTSSWKPENPESDHFIATIYQEILKSFKDDDVSRIQKYTITIDSTSHHSADGKKYGFGSSAVIACGLTYLLNRLARIERDGDHLFQTSLQCHRQAQGDRGSGYDVAASFYGGIGLFIGGESPSSGPVDLSCLPPGNIIPGPESISTVSAVKSYHRFKAERSPEAKRFYSYSNQMVEKFVKAGNWEKAAGILKSYQEESKQFQKQLGIDASTEIVSNVPGSNESRLVKPLGAGNELLSLWGEEDLPNGHVILPINVSQSGPSWE